MKRLITAAGIAAIVFSSSLAAESRFRPAASKGSGVPGAPWATLASPGMLSTNSHDLNGPAPVVYVETTPAYVFRTGENIGVNLELDANGYSGPVTLYVYRQNRVSGQKEFFRIAGGAFGAPGTETDLFGAAGSPVAINVPTLANFRLFGTGGALGAGIPVTAGQTGRYQIVVEVRDGSGRHVISRGNAMYAVVDNVEIVQGQITTNRTLTANNAYLLRGAVFVNPPATLTIEPGTVIIGERTSIGTLIVSRGAKIMAEGTNMQPIIMTSDQPVGSRARTDWGGLIINGFAPINRPGGTGEGEGSTGIFGGNNPADDSGIVRYLRIEWAGREFSPDNELNGITLQGTGTGTVLEYIQVHFNKDDGIEFFGGTTNCKYILLTGNADDSFDWTDGWDGDAQFVLVVQRGDDADNGIEADNLEDNFDALPRSNPTMYNMTFIGDPFTGEESTNGIVLRRGTAAKIHNTIVTGFKRSSLAIRDTSTFNQTSNGELVFDNSILFHLQGRDFERATDGSLSSNGNLTRTFITETMRNNRVGVDPLLTDPYELRRPDASPLPGSPALDARFVRTPPDNGFFDTTVDFVGAVGPNHNWPLTGWATYADN